MSDQLDLFGAPPAPPPPAAVVPAPRPLIHPWPNAHLRPAPEILAIAGASPASLAALADIVLLDELPPAVPGTFPRVAVERAGWDRAMAHRLHLVQQMLAGTLTPGDAEALSALSHVELQRVDWSPEGPIIVTASGYDHAAQALAGLRCAAREHQDG